jgi:hypothetical protein
MNLRYSTIAITKALKTLAVYAVAAVDELDGKRRVFPLEQFVGVYLLTNATALKHQTTLAVGQLALLYLGFNVNPVVA